MPMIPILFAELICKCQMKKAGNERILMSKAMSVTLDSTYMSG